MKTEQLPRLDLQLASRADRVFREQLVQSHQRTDRLFALIMGIQWLAGIALAVWISPLSWVGPRSQLHLHVWLAGVGGAVFMCPGVVLALFAPGRATTRHVIAVGQMLESALLIHITGGRIETHFHIFGSLAFLAFYRDGRVLVTGSLVVAADHVLRGWFWPQSVYGVLYGNTYRWLEHTAWVFFTDLFLFQACRQSLRQMRDLAIRQVRLEAHQELTENEVVRRTRELRESEERFREMAEHIDEVFWVTNADLSQILYVSPGYEKIWGRKPSELLARPASWAESIHPEDRERVWQIASSHASTGGYRLTYRLVRPDGSIRWVYDHGTAIRDGEGRVVRLAGTVVDITPLKQIEENLVRSNLELERFAYVASHDLQEPLRSVSSFLQILKRKYQGRLDREADDYIGFAVDGAHRMKELIQDLLAYSRLNSQSKPFEPVSMNDVLDIALENLNGAIEESGAKITREPLPEVMADGSQMTQVFQNLIANAIKFREDRPPEIHIGAERTADGWEFRVQDNGIGIDPQFADRIFVLFQRLNGQKYAGSGIGLTLCKKIVERHKGRIWFDSAVHHGTTFTFLLPAAQVPAKDESAPKRVLVVDDDPGVAGMIRKCLEPVGIEVDEARSGEEGLEMARRIHPQALLLDVDLPGQNGNAVRRAFRADPATRGIPIVMITGQGELLDPGLATPQDWLPKPLSSIEVRKRVQRLVGSGSGL